MIYIQEQNPFADETLVVEEDENSIWVYRVDSEKKIVQDVLFCSTGKLVENSADIKEASITGQAPPLLRSFANELYIQKGLTEDDISINWLSVDEVEVCLKSQPFVKLSMATNETFSRAVNKDGPFGKAWK
ncbi:hypothetical protein GYB22_02335 [bacterium]|nr:hypothetical protein [bacterium]